MLWSAGDRAGRFSPMKYVSTKELGRAAASLVERVKLEPVTIREGEREVAVLLSVDEYQRLTQRDIDEFNRYCDLLGRRAAARGLTEAKIAELLAADAAPARG